MNEQMKEKIERQREARYLAVKNADIDLYRRALEIGHLPIFIADREKAACEVEVAVMFLLAEVLGL